MNAATNKHSHARNILFVALLAAGSLLIAFALTVALDVNRIEKVWNELNTLHSDKMEHLLELNSTLGYGGVIHYQKNFILTGNEVDHNRFHEKLGSALANTQSYLQLELTTDEHQAVQQIHDVLLRLAYSTTQAEYYHRGTQTTWPWPNDKPSTPDIPAREIDRLTLIEDGPLIQALEQLNRQMWQRLSPEQRQSKAIVLAQLRSVLGYSGFIHQFKNYILYAKPEDWEATQASLQQATQLTRQYAALMLNEQERAAVQQLDNGFTLFRQALEQATSLQQQKLPAEQINQQLALEGNPASAALETLSHQISYENNQRAIAVQRSLHHIYVVASIGVVVTSISVLLLLLINSWTHRDQLRYEQNISRAQRRLGAILDNTADAIIVSNENGTITEFNHAAEHMFGYTAQEIIGKNVSLIMPASDAAQHDKYMQRYQKYGVQKIIGIGRETWAKRKDGSQFPIQLSIGKSSVGGEIAFTGIVRDITKEHNLREEIIRAKNTAEEANKAKSQFLTAMSHELRTPLNAIIGLSQLLATDTSTQQNPETREALNDIHYSGRHLLNLISDVLDFAKLENSKLSIQIGRVSPNDCLDSAIAMSQPQADKFNIRIHRRYPENLPAICADALRLRQVLLNLLSNAIKYNVAGGQIVIETERRKHALRISVSDTGKGIDSQYHAELFMPFKRLGEENSTIEGTGIGLSICKTLIELMHGQIGFRSTPGQGSTFWIELPISDNETDNCGH